MHPSSSLFVMIFFPLHSFLPIPIHQDMEISIQKAEQEKTNRDHTIRNMNDEIAHQDELINKLNKEKKHMAESQSKQTEDLGSNSMDFFGVLFV